jgi:hypothetical protein
MNISSSVSMGSYRPAEMSIHNRAAEFTIDWRRVWDSIGLENPQAYFRGKNKRIAQEAAQSVSQKVQDGDRVAQSVKNKGENVFGKLAFEEFMREGKPQIMLVAMPSAMPDIKFTTYMPEIRIEPQKPAPSTSVIMQQAAANSFSFINMRV